MRHEQAATFAATSTATSGTRSAWPRSLPGPASPTASPGRAWLTTTACRRSSSADLGRSAVATPAPFRRRTTSPCSARSPRWPCRSTAPPAFHSTCRWPSAKRRRAGRGSSIWTSPPTRFRRWWTSARWTGRPAATSPRRRREIRGRSSARPNCCWAQRPAMIVGKGARWSEPVEQLTRPVDTLVMPFLPSPMGRGFIPDDHMLNFNAARSALMQGTDIVLVVGARLN